MHLSLRVDPWASGPTQCGLTLLPCHQRVIALSMWQPRHAHHAPHSRHSRHSRHARHARHACHARAGGHPSRPDRWMPAIHPHDGGGNDSRCEEAAGRRHAPRRLPRGTRSDGFVSLAACRLHPGGPGALFLRPSPCPEGGSGSSVASVAVFIKAGPPCREPVRFQRHTENYRAENCRLDISLGYGIIL